jgi:glutamate--cysteine ligase
MRALDLNPFQPLGIDEPTARFIEALLLTCLLTDSPSITTEELRVNNSNQLMVANNGRRPNVELVRNGKTISLQAWASDILQQMQPICTALDENEAGQPYSQSLALQEKLVANADLTPSAQMLAKMREINKPFACFAVTQSAEHARFFATQPLDNTTRQTFIDSAHASHQKQQALEDTNQPAFDQFLKNYFLGNPRVN